MQQVCKRSAPTWNKKRCVSLYIDLTNMPKKPVFILSIFLKGTTAGLAVVGANDTAGGIVWAPAPSSCTLAGGPASACVHKRRTVYELYTLALDFATPRGPSYWWRFAAPSAPVILRRSHPNNILAS